MENACAFASYPDADCLECGDSGEVFVHADDCNDDSCAMAGGIDDCTGLVAFCNCEAGEALAVKKREGETVEPDLDDQIQEAANTLNALMLAAFNAGLAVVARVEPIHAEPSAPMVIVDVTEKR